MSRRTKNSPIAPATSFDSLLKRVLSNPKVTFFRVPMDELLDSTKLTPDERADVIRLWPLQSVVLYKAKMQS